MLGGLPSELSTEILSFLNVKDLCKISLCLKQFAETSFYWHHVTSYQLESFRLPSTPYRQGLFLDFLYRRAETLHPTAPATIILDKRRNDDMSSWTQYLIAMSSWQTVGSLFSAGSIPLAVLLGCFSRWPRLNHLSLGDESLQLMLKLDECPFLKLQSLTLTGNESLPSDEWGDSYSSLSSLNDICLHTDVLPDPTFKTEDSLQSNLAFMNKLPKQIPMRNVRFQSAFGSHDLLGVAIVRHASLEVISELAQRLPPPSADSQNPIFAACCFLELDSECYNVVSHLIKIGYSVRHAFGSHDGDRMHAILIAIAKSLTSTVGLLLAELPEDFDASELLYSASGCTPLSIPLFPDDVDVFLLLDSHKLAVDINIISSSGTTAFFEAARASKFAEAEKLYSRGADPFILAVDREIASEDIALWRDCLIYLKIVTVGEWFQRYASLQRPESWNYVFADVVSDMVKEHGDLIWSTLEKAPMKLRLKLIRCWYHEDEIFRKHAYPKLLNWIDQATTKELQSLAKYSADAVDPEPEVGIALMEKLFAKGVVFQTHHLTSDLVCAIVNEREYFLNKLLAAPRLFSPEWQAFLLGFGAPLPRLLEALEPSNSLQDEPIDSIVRLLSAGGSKWREALCLGFFCSLHHESDEFEVISVTCEGLEQICGHLRNQNARSDFDAGFIERFFASGDADDEWLVEKVVFLLSALCPEVCCNLARRNLISRVNKVDWLNSAAKHRKFPQMALQGLFVSEFITAEFDTEAVAPRLEWYFDQGLQLDFIPPSCADTSILLICCDSILEYTACQCLRYFLSRLEKTAAHPTVTQVVCQQDWFGKTPLHRAVRQVLKTRKDSERYYRIIRNLLRLGASPTVVDVTGEAAISYCAEEPYFLDKPRIVALLEEVSQTGGSKLLEQTSGDNSSESEESPYERNEVVSDSSDGEDEDEDSDESDAD